MTARKQKIAIGTVCTVLGVVGGGLATSVRATFAARTYAREFVIENASTLTEPIRRDLVDHTKKADAAMAPGGAMHEHFTGLSRRVDWLVKDRVCHIDPQTQCPSVAEVLAPGAP